MHEARPGIGGHQGDDAIADLGVVLRREGPHHDAHGPDHLHADMGSSDTLSGSSAPEIGIFRAPHEPPGVFVNRVRALHVAQIGHGQERGHIGVVHKLRAAETIDLEGVDFSELRMLHDSVLLQCPGHLVGQRRALGGKLPLAVHRRQDLGGLP